MLEIGDKVQIKDLQLYNITFENDEYQYESTGLLPSMLQYGNAIGEIVNKISDGHEVGYILDVDDETYIWFEEFLEKIED